MEVSFLACNLLKHTLDKILIGFQAQNFTQNCTHPCFLASFPVPRPAFRRLQYGKAGRACRYISSREHDVIKKWQNFQNEDATFSVLFSHLHVQRSVSMTIYTPRLLDTCGVLPGTFVLLAVLRSTTLMLNFRSFYPFLPLTSLT